MGYAKIYKRWIKKEVQNKQIKKGEKKIWEKIAHVLAKIYHKREIYFKEHSRIRLATKYPHTCTSWSKNMTSLSLDSGFDLTIYAR